MAQHCTISGAEYLTNLKTEVWLPKFLVSFPDNFFSDQKFSYMFYYSSANGVTCTLEVTLNSLTTKKLTTKLSSANFQKMLSPGYIILRIQRLEGKHCRSR